MVQILKNAEAVAFMQAEGMLSREPNSRQAKFWDIGQVYYLSGNRTAEYGQSNSPAFPETLIAIFDNDEYLNYRRKLPLHYRRFG